MRSDACAATAASRKISSIWSRSVAGAPIFSAKAVSHSSAVIVESPLVGVPNEMPGVPDAPKIESSKDAGSPHTRVVCGLPRTPDGEDLQVRQAWRVSCLGLLALMVLLV